MKRYIRCLDPREADFPTNFRGREFPDVIPMAPWTVIREQGLITSGDA